MKEELNTEKCKELLNEIADWIDTSIPDGEEVSGAKISDVIEVVKLMRDITEDNWMFLKD